MLVISNTSPITHLARIQRLDLLRDLYSEITLPTEVLNDLLRPARSGLPNPGAQAVQSEPWFRIYTIANPARCATLIAAYSTPQRSLDPGEAEAIVAAEELRADLLLMDDPIGRAAAQALGLPFTGLVGVVRSAKKRQLIPLAQPLLDELIAHGYRLDAAIRQRVLMDEDEWSPTP